MFKVTFQGPVIVGDAVALAELLGSAGVAAIVEPVFDTVDSAPSAPAEVQQTTAPAARRGRKPKDKEEPATGQTGTSGETGQAEPASNTVAGTTAESADPGKGDSKGDKPPEVNTDLMDRFTALVDRDYDSALKLLEHFGVMKFSELKDEQQAGFADALTQLNA